MARISGVDLPNDKELKSALPIFTVSVAQPLMKSSKQQASILTPVAEI